MFADTSHWAQGLAPFSVGWYTNGSEALVSLEVTCAANTSSVCADGEGYRLNMRTASEVGNNIVWSAYEIVEYPGSNS